MKTKHLLFSALGASTLLAATSANAATTFVTNTGGNAAALNGHEAGSSSSLPLSAEDGGGTITLTTTSVLRSGNADELFMDADSMGVQNDKFGSEQNWTFTVAQTISFDALTFKTINENMTLRSTAWVGDADATGTGWSFNGTTGEFTILGSNGPGTYDFTSAGVSDVAAGTEIGFGFFTSAAGGEELSSFTITVIPEPSAVLLGGLGFLALLRRRR